MDIPKYTTKARKGQHLTAEERHDIEVHLRDGWSTYKIAKHLGRSYRHFAEVCAILPDW